MSEFDDSFSGGPEGFAGVGMKHPGKDVYAGKRKMIEVIRLALLDAMTDAEIRRFYGLKRGEIITPVRRSRAAKAKAGAVYDAIIDGWKAGALRPLNGFIRELVDGDYVWKKSNGVNIGGILRLGTIESRKFKLWAADEYGESLEDQGIPMFRRQTYPTGVYAYHTFAEFSYLGQPGYTAAHLVELRGRGWFVPWWAEGGNGRSMMFGPCELPVFGGLVHGVPYINGAVANFTGGMEKHGWKNPENDLNYSWAYREPGTGLEKKVKWWSDAIAPGAVPVRRIKARIIDKFWVELNGVVL